MEQVTAFRSNDGGIYLTKEDAENADKIFEVKNIVIDKIIPNLNVDLGIPADESADFLMSVLLDEEYVKLFNELSVILNPKNGLNNNHIVFGVMDSNGELVRRGNEIFVSDTLGDAELIASAGDQIIEFHG